MPIKMTVHVCTICHTAHRDKNEATWCNEECGGELPICKDEDGFTCPICEDIHKDEDDAENCRWHCATHLKPKTIDGFVCGRCGCAFEGREACARHEKNCTDNPARVQGSCIACKLLTAEGYFAPECKMAHPNLPVSECTMYEAALR